MEPAVKDLNLPTIDSVATGLVSGAVGLATGLYGSYDKPGSSFVAVATQVAMQTVVPLYVFPTASPFKLGVVNGVIMTGVTLGFHRFSVNTSVKYGLIVGGLTYGAILLISKVKKQEKE